VKRCVGQRHLAKAFGIGIRKGFGRGIWQRDLAFGIWQRHLAKAFIWQRGKGTWQRGKGIWQRRKQAFGKEARAFGKGGNRRHVRCSQGGDFACARTHAHTVLNSILDPATYMCASIGQHRRRQHVRRGQTCFQGGVGIRGQGWREAKRCPGSNT